MNPRTCPVTHYSVRYIHKFRYLVSYRYDSRKKGDYMNLYLHNAWQALLRLGRESGTSLCQGTEGRETAGGRTGPLRQGFGKQRVRTGRYCAQVTRRRWWDWKRPWCFTRGGRPGAAKRTGLWTSIVCLITAPHQRYFLFDESFLSFLEDQNSVSESLKEVDNEDLIFVQK